MPEVPTNAGIYVAQEIVTRHPPRKIRGRPSPRPRLLSPLAVAASVVEPAASGGTRMRLAAILAVLVLYAGSTFACPYHDQTASNGQAVAQSDDSQQVQKSTKSGS